MSRHEIEIEGLPEGWEMVSAKCESLSPDASIGYFRAQLRRKVRKYDWSKTLDDVLVLRPNTTGMTLYCGHGRPTAIPDGIWQPNIHGKCPVDGESCWVRVKRANGRDSEEMLASSICWGFGFGAATIISWQFIRLADGYEW